jgi:sigma-B regulation protein RsbU (phosphoserine phosphatase)
MLRQLRGTLGRLEVALGSISDAIVWTSADEMIEWSNAVFDRLVGKPRIETLGHRISAVLVLEENGVPVPAQSHPVRLALLDGKETSGVYGLAGTTRQLEILARPVDLASGEAHAIVTIRDCTERQELAHTRLLSIALQATIDAVVITDPQGLVRWVNDAFVTLTGYVREEIYGQGLTILRSGQTPLDTYRSLWETILAAEPWVGRLVNRRKDGTCYVEKQSITPVLGADGEITHFVAIKQDITEQERIAQDLRVKEQAIASAQEGIVIASATEPDQPIVYVNPAFERITGYSADDVLGTNCRLLQGPETDPEALRQLREALAQGLPCTVELANHRKDGSPFWNHLSVAAVRDDKGSPSHFIGIQSDFTDRRRAEQEIAEARDREVQIASRIQQDLLIGPRLRSWRGLSLGTLTIPSQEVDGDFYDLIEQEDGVLDVVVGDVMGKGVPASLLGASAKTEILRALLGLQRGSQAKASPEPSAIVAAVHRAMVPELIALECAITLCYARIDTRQGRLRCVDCGHTSVIHYRRAEDRCVQLKGENLPLGFVESADYGEIEAPLATGDILLFYSDGLTEARRGDWDFFGEQRLETAVRAYADLAPDALIAGIRQDIVHFSGTDRFTDDFTCVAARIGEHASPDGLAHEVFETVSELDELAAVRSAVRKFCNEIPGQPVPTDRLDHVEIGVNEAVTNIIRHAYQGRPGQPITLDFHATAEEVRIVLLDFGQPFSPESVAQPVFDGTRDGGFGVFIIRQCFDKVEYQRDGQGRNRLVLKLSLPEPADAP